MLTKKEFRLHIGVAAVKSSSGDPNKPPSLVKICKWASWRDGCRQRHRPNLIDIYCTTVCEPVGKSDVARQQLHCYKSQCVLCEGPE